MPRALVITGFGLNCEAETSHALHLAGWQPDRLHLNDLLADPGRLADYALLVLIGGFSYGDHLGAGRALAIRLRYGLADELARFVAGGGLVLGICNGFQVLSKLGLLPGFEPFSRDVRQLVTLTHNDSGVFRDDWVRLRVDPASPCVFTRGLATLEFPVRHGEGKFMAADDAVLVKLRANRQIVYQYCDAAGEPTMAFPDNPNGSTGAIAGICDPEGRIFGTMPHPEALIFAEQHPQAARLRALGQPLPEPQGLSIFRNALEAVANADCGARNAE
jgi:phosphoribosylformylglycinamidine synthase